MITLVQWMAWRRRPTRYIIHVVIIVLLALARVIWEGEESQKRFVDKGTSQKNRRKMLRFLNQNDRWVSKGRSMRSCKKYRITDAQGE